MIININENVFQVFFDGGCKSYDQEIISGAGIAVFRGGVFLEYQSFYVKLKDCKNSNQAEYLAFRYALKKAAFLKGKGHFVEIFGDSNLVVTQFNGDWKVSSDLMPYYRIVRDLGDRLGINKITHVLRRYNSKADYLATLAMTAHYNKYSHYNYLTHL